MTNINLLDEAVSFNMAGTPERRKREVDIRQSEGSHADGGEQEQPIDNAATMAPVKNDVSENPAEQPKKEFRLLGFKPRFWLAAVGIGAGIFIIYKMTNKKAS